MTINFPYFVLRGKGGDQIYFKQAKIIEADKYKMVIQAKFGLSEANFNIINSQCCVTPTHTIKKDIRVIRKTSSFELTVIETLTFGYINNSDYWDYKVHEWKYERGTTHG